MTKYSFEELSALPNVDSKSPYIHDLSTKGWCVVPSVIPAERAAQYCDRAFKWLEDFGLGFKRDDSTTWTEDHLPVSNKGGLYNAYGVGHEDWVWDVRCEPGVIRCFEELYGTKELLVSFDGANVTFPYGPHGRTDIELTPPWPHQDQNPYRPFFEIAQGIVALSESGPDDGGLVVIEGSHLKHQEFFEATGGIDDAKRHGKPNSYLYDVEEAEWYKAHGCKEVKVTCPPGSVIMWDSRLIHYNRMPTGTRTRIATYACYCPKALATPEILARKAEVFQNRWNTSHWPVNNEVRVLRFGPPLRNGKPDPHNRDRPVHEPTETDTLLKLVGIKAY